MTLRDAIYKEAQRRAGNTETTQKLADVAQFIPGVGGAISGVLEPATGSSRAESMAVQGGMGVLGAGMVGLPTAAVFALLAAKLAKTPKGKAKAAAIGGLAGLTLGGSVGTMAGSNLGHWMARREVMTPADWKQLSRGMAKTANSKLVKALKSGVRKGTDYIGKSSDF